jgi:hypothetical protein
LAFVPPEQRDEICADLGLLRVAFDAGIVPSRTRSQDSSWAIWTTFCRALETDPTLADVDDPILLLQLFAQHYRDGRIAPHQNLVRSCTVEDALHTVGQGFA